MLSKSSGPRLRIVLISGLIFFSLFTIPTLGDSARKRLELSASSPKSSNSVDSETQAPAPPATEAADAASFELAETAPQTTYPAFTMSASRSVTGADGQTHVLSLIQRFQRSDGSFKLVQTSSSLDGTTERTQTNFGFIGYGVFRLDQTNRRLIFTGPQIDEVPADVEAFLRSHSLYIRDESVQGVSCVVWRKPGRTRSEFTEEYRAPSLGGLLVKTVKVSARGREVLEPTLIQMGEPASALFSELLLYPSDYSNYERQIQETLRQNEPEVARLMQQLLDRMRQARP